MESADVEMQPLASWHGEGCRILQRYGYGSDLICRYSARMRSNVS